VGRKQSSFIHQLLLKQNSQSAGNATTKGTKKNMPKEHKEEGEYFSE
jgi:hypothetical protein